MKYNEILKILNKYEVNTLDDLDYCLSEFENNNECIDDEIQETKDCLNAKCYDAYFVPDCRKMIEIYQKYFQKDIASKKSFIAYLNACTSKSKSSIENYLSCKSCNQQIRKGIQSSLKISDSEFKKDFCNNLSIKFNYDKVFQTDYRSVHQFLNRELQVNTETFIPEYREDKNKMSKEEEHKLFTLTHTSKEIFATNLKNKDNVSGSSLYLFNLALKAFDRTLIDESQKIMDIIAKEDKVFSLRKVSMQLQAKLFSAQKKDAEAITLLRTLITQNQPNIDSETYNVLGASIKREALEVFKKYGDEARLEEKLKESELIYYNVYQLTHDYYPALNYLYLHKIRAYINAQPIEGIIKEAKEIWQSLEHKIVDWWSFIAQIEYLIIVEAYDEVFSEFEKLYHNIEESEVSDFNIFSTIRQLELYANFCDDGEILELIRYLEKR